MVIIGCYWRSSANNSELIIECIDDQDHSWTGPIFPATSQAISGFSSVANPTAADMALVRNGLLAVLNELHRHGHQQLLIREKTYTRNAPPVHVVGFRGQLAATQLTRNVKDEIHTFGQANQITVEEVEDLPTNRTTNGRGNYLQAVNGLFNLCLGTMSRDQKMAVCIALKIANGRQHSTTTANKIIRGWGARTNIVMNRANLAQQRNQLFAVI